MFISEKDFTGNVSVVLEVLGGVINELRTDASIRDVTITNLKTEIATLRMEKQEQAAEIEALKADLANAEKFIPVTTYTALNVQDGYTTPVSILKRVDTTTSNKTEVKSQ